MLTDLTRRSIVCPSWIGENLPVPDYPHPAFVGAPLQPDHGHRHPDEVGGVGKGKACRVQKKIKHDAFCYDMKFEKSPSGAALRRRRAIQRISEDNF